MPVGEQRRSGLHVGPHKGFDRSRGVVWDGVATITAGERELGEELGNPLIENRAVVAAGLVTQGTSKPRFAHAGGPAQNQIVVRVCKRRSKNPSVKRPGSPVAPE